MRCTPHRSIAGRLSTVVAATLVALPLAATSVSAQDRAPHEPVVRVSGTGEASVAPDMAIINLTVARNGETAQKALADNNAAMNQVLTALKKAGIADKDLQTSNFSIYPQYQQNEPKDGRVDPPRIIGYEVQNGLTVKIRDLKALGNIIDQSVTLGVNQGGQITFTNDDPSAARSEARKKAVADAMDKALTLTEAAGVKVGKVIDISEGEDRFMPPSPAPRMAMMKAQSDGVAVAAGENTYSIAVTMTFAIEDK
ncbi:SIMPL domain-containing protein [Neorhizobium sp. NPDC001467]|uniref:SIMPL domain-containing protein n=1 Tax=Neorhizobium sp. NPDC001467 TaxID=3390595 RepID=UPI003D00DDAF